MQIVTVLLLSRATYLPAEVMNGTSHYTFLGLLCVSLPNRVDPKHREFQIQSPESHLQHGF